MKVLRSKCRTRVIFAKGEQDIITRKLSDVSAVQLVNGEIQFLDNDNAVIISANWEAVDVPETFTALEKVIHLNEWLACCDEIDSKDFYYNAYVHDEGFDIVKDEGDYSDFYEFPLSYTFDDDLSLKSAWEVHFSLSFKTDVEPSVVGKVVAFVDKNKVFGAKARFQMSEFVTANSVSLHFILEGDNSCKNLTFGLAHEAQGSLGGSGLVIPIEDVNSTLIVRKLR